MSPGPAFIPLITRVHHLASSWTQFPSLHTPAPHHNPSCSPSSRTTCTTHSRHSVWFDCVCMCYMYYVIRVRSVYSLWIPALCCRLWCPILFSVLFLACWPFRFLPVGLFVFCPLDFLFIKKRFSCSWTQTSVLRWFLSPPP